MRAGASEYRSGDIARRRFHVHGVARIEGKLGNKIGCAFGTGHRKNLGRLANDAIRSSQVNGHCALKFFQFGAVVETGVVQRSSAAVLR
jgi:hypothetical protein